MKLMTVTENGKQNSTNGFSLIEIAISLVIIGVLLVGAMQAYNLYQINYKATRTLEAVSGISTALAQYKNANGRYPCPAPLLEAKDTSPNYGHETDCADPNIGTASVVNPGECLLGATPPDNYNGICIEQSTRTIAGVNPRVRVGAIPFRELQIDEKDTFDGYGSRLVYALTETMGVAGTYKDSEAAIELQDGNGNVLSSGDRSVAFVVFSPGKNRNGAVSVTGTTRPCDATMMDGGNCRDFSSATNTQSIYVMAAQSDGTAQFDDVMEYFVPIESEVWRREAPTSENILDRSEDKVGVGIANPSELTDELTIRQSTVNKNNNMANMRALAPTNTLGGNNESGALRVGKYAGGVHSGKVLADKYCTEDGASCFETKRITGTYDNDPVAGTSGMGCPAGQYMIGIEGDRAKCAPVRIFCAPGTAMTGTDASGAPVCATPLASCLTEIVTLCGTNYSLAAAGHNAWAPTLNYTTGGACANANYQCDQGTWVKRNGYDTAYACSYVAATPTTGSTTVTCGTGYTGTYTQNHYLNCLGNTVNTTNTSATDCTCTGIEDDVYCPAAFGSVHIGKKKRVCSGPAPGTLDAAYTVFTASDGTTYPTEAAMIAAKCSCSKVDDWDFALCDTGKVRASPPAPLSFTAPVEPWDPNPLKGKYRKLTIDLATCNYDNPAYNDSNCICAAGTQFRYENPTCTSCQQVDTQTQIRQIRSGASCGWVDDPDTSANTAGTCKARTFIWKNSGVSAGPSNPLAEGHGVSPLCNSSCDCSENGTSTACAQGSAAQWSYFSASCQPN